MGMTHFSTGLEMPVLRTVLERAERRSRLYLLARGAGTERAAALRPVPHACREEG